MRICLFLSFWLMAGWALAQSPQEAPAGDTGRGWHPRYVTFLPADRLDSVLTCARTDLVPVIYRVNKYTLYPNAQTDSILSLIRWAKDDLRVRLAYVWIGGSASPEGPVRWNRQLGDYRSRALADYILAHTDLPASQLRVQNLAEDWESVQVTLRGDSGFPHRDEILHIIATEPDWARRKRQIRAIDGGRTWTRLVRTVFPPFRNSRMVIVCLEQPVLSDVPACEAPPVTDVSAPAFARLVPLPHTPQAPARRRVILLKSNLLAVAAALVANLGFEVELAPHWSLDVPVYYSPYDLFKETRKVRLLATQPEVRYWFGRVSERHFVGLHSHVAGFNVALNGKGRYQDPNRALWGLGVSYGYALPFGRDKRWGAEFNVGFGFANYQYDKYENIGIRPGQQLYSSGTKWYWGVTRAAVSLSYKWNIGRKRRTAL